MGRPAATMKRKIMRVARLVTMSLMMTSRCNAEAVAWCGHCAWPARAHLSVTVRCLIAVTGEACSMGA